MHYYQFHIGDYRAATSHLSNQEDLAYRRLLDMYYDSEAPIPTDIEWVSRRLRLGSEVVSNVLNDMFERTENGYVNKRADAEIKAYHAFKQKQQANGKLGGRPKRTQAKPTANPEQSQAKPKKTLTTNHKPITNTIAVAVARPNNVDEKVWEDFLALRKAKAAPLTETALEGIRSQAEKAKLTINQALQICCARGWQGFNANWVKDEDRKEVEVYKPGFFMGRKLAGGDDA